MRIRFFAGAAEAAGTDELQVTDPVPTGRDLVALLAQGNERLGRVLEVSALLADGARVADLDAPLHQVTSVDVLPPFAGG